MMIFQERNCRSEPDLIALDSNGNLIIFELKRHGAGSYTIDQIMKAGAALMDAGKINELRKLIDSFGVEAVTNLKPEQLGAFATELRKLGAKI